MKRPWAGCWALNTQETTNAYDMLTVCLAQQCINGWHMSHQPWHTHLAAPPHRRSKTARNPSLLSPARGLIKCSCFVRDRYYNHTTWTRFAARVYPASTLQIARQTPREPSRYSCLNCKPAQGTGVFELHGVWGRVKSVRLMTSVSRHLTQSKRYVTRLQYIPLDLHNNQDKIIK